MKTPLTAYALFHGDELMLIDQRIHVFWHKGNAEGACPKGATVKPIYISEEKKP